MRFSQSWTPRTWRRVRRLLVGLAGVGLLFFAFRQADVGAFLFCSGLLGLVLLESEQMRRSVVESYRQQHALTQIRPLMGELPLDLSGWAADAVFINNAVRIIVDIRPRLILECGSGKSTIILGRCLRALGQGQLISLDHDPRYAQRTRELLQLHSLEDVVTIVTAPLVPSRSGTRDYLWYGPEYEPLITRPIDVLLVDGPPGSSGQMSRYPAVPLLQSRLAPECWILLDDGDRPAERAIARTWSTELRAKLQYLDGGRGGWLLHRSATGDRGSPLPA
jgi:predicted O-methyltransferase YrrM